MTVSPNRIIGIDALRAFAMWLGILLHATIAFMQHPRPGWPQNEASFIGSDLLYHFTHSFRMPLFFFIAGFFCNLLLHKREPLEFIKQRFMRIGIPLLMSIVLILPACYYLFTLLSLQQSLEFANTPWREALAGITRWKGLFHLWFLYYLLLFYLLVICLVKFVPSFNKKSLRWNDLIFISCSILLFAIQFQFYRNGIEAWTGLAPKVGQLLYYGFFFFFGFIAYQSENFLAYNSSKRAFYLILASLLLLGRLISPIQENVLITNLILAFETNLFILGWIGLFLMLFRNQKLWIAFLSDSAYWVYLIHLPLLAFLQVLILPLSVNPILKFLMTVLGTTLVALVSYKYLVRNTWLGVILNGSKRS